ncbi:hypothetical protein [Hymenobacter wooponensis]|uniref:Uncharacterized protein n=1 Tax=Hymenobacter wooponensis TaxID=1525360 RepID=A0A4Z0MF25_9BACT|nr:hypothetical protein [Hymenobacter wooponensis]TGD77967.1 hypothetical protein EU557_22020 [Hymenobacter wooponensis]
MTALLLAHLIQEPPYQAIVVDATTSRPLPGVTGLDLATQQRFSTDALGHFTLAGPAAHFQLRHLGFAPLEASRSGLQPGQVDTLRLLPQSILLGEVSVRPTKPVVLSSFGPKVKDKMGVLVVPGSECGVLFRPAPDSPPAVVEQITVQLRPNKPKAGQIRIRLVAPTSEAEPRPTSHDLIPVAATYTAAQLVALPDQRLTVDISAYGLQLPPNGFFVLIEGLGSNYPAEVAVPMQRGDPTPHLILTATNLADSATYRRTPMNDFPAVVRGTSVTEVETYWRQCCNRPWRGYRLTHKPKESENVAVTLVLRALE